MANLLPQHDRTMLRRTYWLRLSIVASLMGAAAMLVALVSLLPAYIAARSELHEVTAYYALIEASQETQRNDASMATARLVRAQIREAQQLEHYRASEAIEALVRIAALSDDGVTLTGIAFTAQHAGDGVRTQIRISGEAAGRTALTRFVDTIRADTRFESVELPIRDLAASGRTPFSIVVFTST